MPNRELLPASIANRPFSTKEAIALGVTPDRLRSSDLWSPFPGTRAAITPDSESRDSVVARAHAYATRMRPHHFFSHVTAAVLWGMPLPQELANPATLDVAAVAPLRAPEVRGVRGRQLSASNGDICVLDGPAVTSPELTWLSLGSVLPLQDVVAAGDFLVTPNIRGKSITHQVRLEQALYSRPRFSGRRIAADALPLVREGPLSRPESIIRLIVWEGGLPEPSLNPRVCDDRGQFLAVLDLAWKEYRVGLEYEGDYHRTTRGQFHRDIARIERLADADWVILRVSAPALFDDPRGLVDRIARRLRARGWVGRTGELRKFGRLVR